MVNRAFVRFREFGHVRAIRRPHSTALPTRVGVVNSSIQSARIKWQRVWNSEHTELFRFRVEDEHCVRSGSSDDHGVFAKTRRVELIYPQEVGEIGGAGFAAGALKFYSRVFPEFPLASLDVQAAEMTAAERNPNIPVRAEVNAMWETSRSRQRVIFEFVRLWIKHVHLVRWGKGLRRGFPNGAVDGADRHTVARSGDHLLGVHIDAHPGLLSRYLSSLDIVEIQLFGVHFTHRVAAAIRPDAVLPIELQVVGVISSVNGDKFIGFRVIVTELHIVT